MKTIPYILTNKGYYLENLNKLYGWIFFKFRIKYNQELKSSCTCTLFIILTIKCTQKCEYPPHAFDTSGFFSFVDQGLWHSSFYSAVIFCCTLI